METVLLTSSSFGSTATVVTKSSLISVIGTRSGLFEIEFSFSRSSALTIFGKAAAKAGKADLADFPLLMHVDEIICGKKPVNIPWETFTFVDETKN